MVKRAVLVGAVLACLVMLSLTQAAAQTTSATIVGDVTDPSNAAIPGVNVTVTHEGTGASRTVQTNEVGQYRVTPLNPGTYSVQVGNTGFKTQMRSGIAVQVAAVIEIDFILELGEVTETIEVTGAAPILQTQEASVGNVVEQSELARIPVNQRNFTRLILLMPGTSSRRSSQSIGTTNLGTELFSVNGGRPQDNNFTLDGIDGNIQMMNSPGVAPPMDSIQEFKVATNTGAEFARSAGANVNLVTKSGTRELHGTVYEYLRNDKLDANEFFANRSGLGKTPFRMNQFGASVGGPVAIPGTRLREKMFWFFNYEGFRWSRGSAQLRSVPLPAFRSGDFSALLTEAKPIVVKNPFDNNNPFTNNIIPAGLINPAVPKALELVEPAPNRPGRLNNLVGNNPGLINRDNFIWRWDYNVNEKNSFMFRWTRLDTALDTPQNNPRVQVTAPLDIRNFGSAWTHIISPQTGLEVRFGMNQNDRSSDPVKLGVTRAQYLDQTGMQMFQREVYSDPLVNLSFGEYGVFRSSGSIAGDKIWQPAVALSTIKGKHSLRFSFQYHWRRYYTEGANPMDGDAIFSGSISGYPMGDALLGYPSEIRRGQGNTKADSRAHFVIGSVQDDYRVSQKLTINVGLMYQMGTRPYDITDQVGNLWVRRDPQTGQYFGDLLWGTTNPAPAPPTGERNLPAKTGGWGRALVGSDRNDFAPRVGLAYRVNDKTVIRSGFGIFYNSTFVQEFQDLRKFWPYTIQQVFSPNRGVLDLKITDAGPAFESTAAIGGWPQNPENRSPYSMQANLFIQHQLLDDLTLDIGYVGSRNRKQIGYTPFNNALTPGPGDIQPRRLLPDFGDLDGGFNAFNGAYNALQFTLKKRFNGGSMFNLNYTFQKSLDGQSSLAEVKVQDPFHRTNDYSRSSWDVNQVFNFSYLYELPFGRGRKFGGGWHSALDAIAGGWAVEGITRLESGPPIFVQNGLDIPNTGRANSRPNLVGDPNEGGLKTPESWFNTAAFVAPPNFTFGSAQQYIANGDGIIGLDVSITKTFRINERHAIEFRSEYFNIGNHPSFDRPNGTLNNALYNQVTRTSVDPRQIQFALRYRF